jgi:hypothetical protein
MAELELTAGTIEYQDTQGDGPVPLVVWTPEDRVARPDHGRRLLELLPDARLVEIRDSYTLIMRGQPEAFARAIREFVQDAAGALAPA